MTKYTVVTQADEHGFDVRIEDQNGASRTILGFETEVDAEAWIRQDERLERAANPFSSLR
jgi:hypothetical protein